MSIPVFCGDRDFPEGAPNRSTAALVGGMLEPIAYIKSDAEKSLPEINDRRPIFTSRAQRLISSRFSHSLLTIIDKALIAVGGAAFWLHRGNGQSAIRSPERIVNCYPLGDCVRKMCGKRRNCGAVIFSTDL